MGNQPFRRSFFLIVVLPLIAVGSACAPERPVPETLDLLGLCQANSATVPAGEIPRRSIAATVRIKAVKKRSGCGMFTLHGGTGTVIDQRRGLILTAAHVVERGVKLEATTLALKANGIEELETLELVPLAVDHHLDVAVLMVHRQEPVPAGIALNCFRPPRRGDFIYHFGQTSLMGYGQVLNPLVLARIGERKPRPVQAMEASAQARKGDSGGPVVDDHGRLIGVVVMQRRCNRHMIFIRLRDAIRSLDGPVRRPE